MVLSVTALARLLQLEPNHDLFTRLAVALPVKIYWTTGKAVECVCRIAPGKPPDHMSTFRAALTPLIYQTSDLVWNKLCWWSTL